MTYLDRVQFATRYDLSRYAPIELESDIVGYAHHELAEVLSDLPEVFQVTTSGLAIQPALTGYEARSEAFDRILPGLRDAGFVRSAVGEQFEVSGTLGGSPLMAVDRSAVEAFGIISSGFHLNGIVGEQMWIARRSVHKPTFPGELDNMVAGGWPRGISLADNVVKECAEEANIPEALARTARPVGVMTYVMEVDRGLRRHAMYLMDLDVPEDFQPQAIDGEVGSFQLMPIDEVAQVVCDSAEFKYNSAVAVINYLVRTGRITPEEDGYVDIIRGMHSPLNVQGSACWARI